MVQSLHVAFGTPLDVKGELHDLSLPLYSFPKIDQLVSRLDGLEGELRALGFGYRARFISETIKLLSKFGLSALYEQRKASTYEEVIAFLLQFPGVGRKVADCVALFSLDQLDAFPIDIHMYKLSLKVYFSSLCGATKRSTLTESEYKRIREHFCNLFKIYPGWAQSILFTSQLKKFALERS